MKKTAKKAVAASLSAAMLIGSVAVPAAAEEAKKWTEEKTADGWIKVTNEGGKTLGYSENSGMKILEDDGFAFKDLNKNGTLDTFEDWRLDDNERAEALASTLTAEQIMPLLFHKSLPNFGEEVGDDNKELLDQGMRAGTTKGSLVNPEMAVKFANTIQEYVESKGLAIPFTMSCDPGGNDHDMLNYPAGNLALAATFDPELVTRTYDQFAKMYRAMGVSTLLGPQVDLDTEPRWRRTSSTFGEDPALARDMTKAAVDALQSTKDADGKDLGWGTDSVLTFTKHFPGDGTGESGRESHNFYGKFAVYPGNNFAAHLINFFDGALNLDGETKETSGMMVSYSVAYSDDGSLGDLVGSAFSDYKIGLLRNNGYDGLLVTDWMTMMDFTGEESKAKPWGVEDLTPAQRIAKSFEVGVDQVGGVFNMEWIKEAYEIMKEDLGEEAALANLRDSARRVFRNYNRVQLFENPYVELEKTLALTEDEELLALGKEYQQKSVVMLKNKDNLIHEATEESAEKKTVYIPMTWDFKDKVWKSPVDLEIAAQYYEVVTDTVGEPSGEADDAGNPTYTDADIVRAAAEDVAKCDMAIAFVSSPTVCFYSEGGYDSANEKYQPLALTYGEYTADSDSVRKVSIAGEKTEDGQENVSYFGEKAERTWNITDLDAILYAKENLPEDGKLIVSIGSKGSMVMSEFEEQADVILMNFGWGRRQYEFHNDYIFDIIEGKVEPSGLLPLQMPANMETVEAQLEDVPRDMECYVDSEGNTYDFTYGLNWSGVISDERTEKYNVAPLTEPETIKFEYATAK